MNQTVPWFVAACIAHGTATRSPIVARRRTLGMHTPGSRCEPNPGSWRHCDFPNSGGTEQPPTYSLLTPQLEARNVHARAGCTSLLASVLRFRPSLGM